MLKALLNMLLGMGSVFIVLIIICLIIYCFKIFPYLDEKKKEKQSVGKTETKPEVIESVIETNVPKEDMGAVVCAITAAITAYTGIPSGDFVVRSIVRKK